MGSAWTCGCRGGVIVPLRPDVKLQIEADQHRTSPRDSATKAAKENRGAPEQLTLFDEPPER
jgi:hypothetical protein